MSQPDSYEPDFDELLLWLQQRLGRRLSVTLTGPTGRPGNVRLRGEGGLLRDDGLLIDRALGRVVAFKVGEAQRVLIEGELVATEYFEPQNVPCRTEPLRSRVHR
jgi:hypothetical protein